jgi:hypothetical protein
VPASAYDHSNQNRQITDPNQRFWKEYIDQFSSNASLRSAMVGGLGRKGARRLIILETDGMANTTPNASFTNSGAYNSYYNIRPADNFSGSDGWSAGSSGAIAVAQRLCALTTDTTNGPGFATPRKPVTIHCFAFGAIFEPTAEDSQTANALSFVRQISSIGGTGFPSSVMATTDPNYYKLCIGTLAQRQAKLRKAFSKILDDGLAVVLVK